MEKVLTAKQMKLADFYTINQLGISKQTLVERAALAVVEEIVKRFSTAKILVCIGKGNNGEDGSAVAKLLSKKQEFSVSTFLVENNSFDVFNHDYDIIVDCIFGIGLNRQVEGKYLETIKNINKSGAFIVSCDISSGLNVDNGQALGVAVKADLTVALQELKIGHLINDGLDYSGEIVVKDIGVSVCECEYVARLSKSDVLKCFPKRNRNTHKGNYGRATVIGGSLNYPGSVYLSLLALATLKSGVGYTNLAIPKSLYQVYSLKNPECIITTIKDNGGAIKFDINSMEKMLGYNSIAIGMGLGQSRDVYDTINYLLNNYKGKLIIDADGLNTLSKYGLEILKNKTCEIILTPHVGEFIRLSKYKKEDILCNPINIAKSFAKEYGVILTLKNAVTIITDGEKVFLNTTGCSGMAKGGSGDALSGFIAGVTSRCEDTILATASACYVFGLAGEIAESEFNTYTMTTTDIIDGLGKAINTLY